MRQLIDNLDELGAAVGSCLILYSGGLDSSWFLLWAREHGLRAVAVHVHLGGGEPSAEVAERAARLGADYRTFDLTGFFAEHYVAPAVRANALYQGAFPVCSSLSRPLMAEVALKVARDESIGCVVHTTTYVQNSAARFNNSLRALSPELLIANPFIHQPVRREEQRRQLAAAGVEVRAGIYSVDENIWGRVIECGELDDPANRVPAHIWQWTAEQVRAPSTPTFVTLGFERGVPVALDGRPLPLDQLIIALNELGGVYGVGRYNGLEDTPFGVKNHEVREAPAATSILAAHAALERAVLTQREIRVKSAADAEWTELITNGFWHSPLREATGELISSLSRFVTGEVVLEYRPGGVFVSAVSAPHALHFWNVSRLTTQPFDNFSYPQYFEIASLPEWLRGRGGWRPAETLTDEALGRTPRRLTG